MWSSLLLQSFYKKATTDCTKTPNFVKFVQSVVICFVFEAVAHALYGAPGDA